MVDERRLDALNQYWNAITRGAPRPADLDPDISGALDWAMARDDAPGPDASFIDELKERLTIEHRENMAPSAIQRTGLNGHGMSSKEKPFRVALPVARTRRRWGIAQLAAAVLLFAGLGIGYVVFGRGFSDDESRTMVPAAVEPAATPSPDPFTEESLVLATLPEGALPVGENVGIWFGQYTVPAGLNDTWVSADNGCCPELRFTHVLVGDYTIRSEGTAQLLRGGADGTWETIAPDTEIILGPGDASIVSTETGGDGANLGSEPVELLHAVIRSGPYVAGSDSSDSIPEGWIKHDGREGTQTFPAGPITLRLNRVELAPRAWVLLPQDGVFRTWLGYTEPAAGTPVAIRVGWASGSAFNVGEETTILYVLTLAP